MTILSIVLGAIMLISALVLIAKGHAIGGVFLIVLGIVAIVLPIVGINLLASLIHL